MYRFLCRSCIRKKGRLILFLTIGFVFIGLVATAMMSAHVQALVSQTGGHRVQEAGRWWPEDIRVKDPMATWHWSVRRRGTVYKMVDSRWTDMDRLCKSEEKYINHTFPTPGGVVTAFFSTFTDVVAFDQTHKGGMLPSLFLATQDSTLTFIDVGADDGVYSLVVAAVGNEVLAVEPYVRNVPKICRGIAASNLSGRCYIVANVLMDESDKPVLIKTKTGYSPTVYKISRDMGGKGSESTTIVLSDLLSQFPMKKVGMRFGVHHDTPAILNGDGAFFDRLDVQFIQMNWYYERSMRHAAAIARFMSERGYTPYGYWRKLVRLEGKMSTWPENVIFRKNRNSKQRKVKEHRAVKKVKVVKKVAPSKQVFQTEDGIRRSSSVARSRGAKHSQRTGIKTVGSKHAGKRQNVGDGKSSTHSVKTKADAAGRRVNQGVVRHRPVTHAPGKSNPKAAKIKKKVQPRRARVSSNVKDVAVKQHPVKRRPPAHSSVRQSLKKYGHSATRIGNTTGNAPVLTRTARNRMSSPTRRADHSKNRPAEVLVTDVQAIIDRKTLSRKLKKERLESSRKVEPRYTSSSSHSIRQVETRKITPSV